MEELEVEILWNYFPEGKVIAHMELDENVIEHFLEKEIDEIEDKEDWKQIIICEGQPESACIIQGSIVLFNVKTGIKIETYDTTCLQNQDIIKLYKEKEELSVIDNIKRIN